MNDISDKPPGDLLLGADSIAQFLGITRRQTYRLVYDGIVPSFKCGGTVAARRSSLTAWMTAAEQGGAANDNQPGRAARMSGPAVAA